MINNRLSNLLIGISLVSLSTITAAQTPVQGGTIRFTGQIVNAACAVSADSTNQVVNMGQYRTASFTAVGDRTGSVPFTIKLEDCDTSVAGTASVAFSGIADSRDTTVLETSNISAGASGAAGGVGVEISDHEGKVVPPNGATFSTATTLFDGANTLNFSARYKSVISSVTPGQADADATFRVQYM